jgi:hypothetical protein
VTVAVSSSNRCQDTFTMLLGTCMYICIYVDKQVFLYRYLEAANAVPICGVEGGEGGKFQAYRPVCLIESPTRLTDTPHDG